MADEDLSELIAQARRRPMNFGLCMGKKPEATIFMMHKLKDPAMLARKAKKAGETPKVASGVAQAKGRALTLMCADDPPSGLARRLKLYFKSQDLNIKVIIADANGTVLEHDDEEDSEDNGLVRKRSFLVTRWKQIPMDLRVHIAKLKATISDNLDYEDADEIGSALEARFLEIIVKIRGEVDSAVVDAVNSGDNSYTDVISIIGKLKREIQSDDLIAVLKKGDVITGQPFEDAFCNALDEVATELSA